MNFSLFASFLIKELQPKFKMIDFRRVIVFSFQFQRISHLYM